MEILISGKEALIALAKGEYVELKGGLYTEWENAKNCVVEHFIQDSFEFRIKPNTIKINGIEVPAPFDPKDGDDVWFVDSDAKSGYNTDTIGAGCELKWIQFGAWRTEDEVKKVVNMLRVVLGGN